MKLTVSKKTCDNIVKAGGIIGALSFLFNIFARPFAEASEEARIIEIVDNRLAERDAEKD